MTWLALAWFALGTYVLRAAGPVFLAGRAGPGIAGPRAGPAAPAAPRLSSAVMYLPAALIGALVALQTLTTADTWALDARALGLLAAVLVLARGAGLGTTVLVAATTAALARALGWA